MYSINNKLKINLPFLTFPIIHSSLATYIFFNKMMTKPSSTSSCHTKNENEKSQCCMECVDCEVS